MFKKSFKRKSTENNGLGIRTVFDNTHEKVFNPTKEYYASIFMDGSSKLVTYKSKFRSDAVAYFNSVARSYSGHVEVVGVLK